MIELNNKVKLTKSELTELQKKAAENGVCINAVKTSDDYTEALAAATINQPWIKGLLGHIENQPKD